MWVITKKINAHNQEGEYFKAVFIEKPTLKELTDLDFPDPAHLLKGGGRKDVESVWYKLRKVQPGKLFNC